MTGRLASSIERSPRTSPAIVARVLGGFEVIADGHRISHADFQRSAAERLVKLLLVTPGHTLARESAAETLWPGADPDASRANLRKALHFAHRALGGSPSLVASGPMVAIDGRELDLDLDRVHTAFARLVGPDRDHRLRAGLPGDQSSAQADDGEADAVEVVLELGARDLLPDDPYEDWLVAPREDLRSRWQRVALRAAARARDLGRLAQAHDLAAQLLDRDPTDEAAHRLEIELYAREGRHHAARRQFEACRRALRRSLDVEPSDLTVQVYREAERDATTRAATPPPYPRLVSRRVELERVEQLLDRVSAGRSAALVIRGPAGIGKTRLLREIAGDARAVGWQVLEWQGLLAAQATAYAPLRVGLGEALATAWIATWDEPARSGVATLLPGLGVPPALVFSARPALVEALVLAVRRLARERPLFIAIDDLPWVDEATLELLGLLVAGAADVPILVAGTYRDDEMVPAAVAGMAEQVRRSGGVELTLGPIALGDVEPLVTAHLGGETMLPSLASLLHEQSRGNPLFCLELVRNARQRGTLRLEDGRWIATAGDLSADLPDSVRRLVAARSGSLPSAAREIVATAAELGSTITFESFAAVLGDMSGGVIDALDAALASGLLAEQGGGYAFTHPLFRLAVRGELSPARRGAIQLRIARTLGGLQDRIGTAELGRAAQRHPDPIPVAEHALAAWDLGVPEAQLPAVAFGFAAGEVAMRLFDRASATSLFERALAASRRLRREEAGAFDLSRAHWNLAELRMAAGDGGAAEAAFRDAISTARTPDELAIAYDRFAWLYYRHGDFEGTVALLEEALGRMPLDAFAARAKVRETIAWCIGRLHRFDEAIAMLEECAQVAESVGNRRDGINVLDRLGTMLVMVGRDEEAIERLEQALAIALELGDVRGETVRCHLGTALTRSGHPGRARPHLERALEICHQMGDRYLESIAAWMTAENEDALGNLDAARSMRRRELGLLESIGGNPHNQALAHAHLAHLARRAGDAATAAIEASRARELAARDPDPGYPGRVEQFLSAARWSDLRTG